MNKYLLNLLIILSLSFVKTSFANQPENQLFSSLAPTEPFVFFTEPVGESLLLRVSFNGEERGEGTLKIYTTSNELVVESNFELISSPYYASVDVTSLPTGHYNLELTTSVRSYTSTLTIE